jgi:hypothetical protein
VAGEPIEQGKQAELVELLRQLQARGPAARQRVVASMADHQLSRAIVVLSNINVIVDETWLPLLEQEAARRGLPVTRSN